VILSRPTFAAAFAALLACLPATAQEKEKPEIPADLLEDAHVREELAINEFTAPSIAKIFESLESLAPLPILKFQRETPKNAPLDRAGISG